MGVVRKSNDSGRCVSGIETLAETLREAQGECAVVRPSSGGLVMRAKPDHVLNRVGGQELSAAKLYRNAEGIADAETEDAAEYLLFGHIV
jgi:hypothetical protein